jgi:DNA-binding winged helix-turn-helix (wHTH) protein/TolB-like protein/tetratricopeptide (TPR) repeat protein
MADAHARYEFGDFALDVGQQRLSRRGNGEAIPLTARVFDTLVFLVEHAGTPLTKDELLRAVWPGVIVEENSLAQNISTLRQALGETRGENRYIATIARKGYQFVAPVTRRERIDDAPVAAPAAAAPPPSVPSRSPAWFAVLALGMVVIALVAIGLGRRDADAPAAAPASANTLAILPFKPLLPAQRNESLELGMTESLIANLARDSTRSIAPLSSVRRYATLDKDAVAAGRELGVASVLEGSLQRSGDRLRVSVRLLRVADGQQLWTRTFDQDYTTIFEVQDTIASRVAQALSQRPPGVAGKAISPPTRDPEAYALYASGRFAWTRQTEDSLLQAIDFFEQAIARDPDYALAYTGLADSYAVLGVFGIRAPREVFPRARAAAERALAIDPDLAAAHSALGHIKAQYEHDWDGAARDYARALQLDPSVALTHHRRGLLYAMQGDTERALAESEQAQRLEPLWLAAKAVAGNFLYYAKRHDESIQRVQQVLALDERADNARGFLIRNLIATGEHERALAELDKGPLQMPGSHAFRAQALAGAGRRDEAFAERDRVLALSAQRYVAAFDIALIHAALGDHEAAFDWLERAMQDRSTLLVFLAREPMLEALHADPRFQALVDRVGIFGHELPDIAEAGAPM